MKHPKPLRKAAAIGSMTVFCSLLAFVLGLQTSNVKTMERTHAALLQDTTLGDMDVDGVLTIADAIALLERTEGLEVPTPEDIKKGDMDGDLLLTGKDAIRLLNLLSHL